MLFIDLDDLPHVLALALAFVLVLLLCVCLMPRLLHACRGVGRGLATSSEPHLRSRVFQLLSPFETPGSNASRRGSFFQLLSPFRSPPASKPPSRRPDAARRTSLGLASPASARRASAPRHETSSQWAARRREQLEAARSGAATARNGAAPQRPGGEARFTTPERTARRAGPSPRRRLEASGEAGPAATPEERRQAAKRKAWNSCHHLNKIDDPAATAKKKAESEEVARRVYQQNASRYQATLRERRASAVALTSPSTSPPRPSPDGPRGPAWLGAGLLRGLSEAVGRAATSLGAEPTASPEPPAATPDPSRLPPPSSAFGAATPPRPPPILTPAHAPALAAASPVRSAAVCAGGASQAAPGWPVDGRRADGASAAPMGDDSAAPAGGGGAAPIGCSPPRDRAPPASPFLRSGEASAEAPAPDAAVPLPVRPKPEPPDFAAIACNLGQLRSGLGQLGQLGASASGAGPEGSPNGPPSPELLSAAAEEVAAAAVQMEALVRKYESDLGLLARGEQGLRA